MYFTLVNYEILCSVKLPLFISVIGNQLVFWKMGVKLGAGITPTMFTSSQ